ncbi:MAG: LamG domain-containing protein, partial [Bacteroidetes bacterium]|nr:LamG domain-containing protein [Bacteroidota bacterium]
KELNLVAVVVDSASMRIYINGVLTQTTGWTGTPAAPSSTAAMLIGVEQGLTFPLTGQLDEVRVWNVTRPVDQIQLFMMRRLINYIDYTSGENNGGSLAYYQFDEGGGVGSA